MRDGHQKILLFFLFPVDTIAHSGECFCVWLRRERKEESFGVCLSYLNSHHSPPLFCLLFSKGRIFLHCCCVKFLPFLLFCSFNAGLASLELLRSSKEDGLIEHFYISWCLDPFKCSRSLPETLLQFSVLVDAFFPFDFWNFILIMAVWRTVKWTINISLLLHLVHQSSSFDHHQNGFKIIF